MDMAFADKNFMRKLYAFLSRQDVILVFLFMAMILVFTVFNPRFFSLRAGANILQDFSPVMLMAIGQTFVIISRGIDLSVGSTLGLSGICMALVIRAMNLAGFDSSFVIVIGLTTAIGVGAFIGSLNATLIVTFKIAPFVATLATMGAAAGLSLVLTGGVQIAGAPRAVIDIGNKTFLNFFTLPVISVFIIILLSYWVLSITRFGRWTYAIGSNSFAARGAGINIKRHLTKIYLLSGIMASLAGAFVYFRLGSGSPLSGRSGELSAIAAVVIGGASLNGGVGRITGTIMGTLITTAVISGLIFVGVQPHWQQVVIAILIATAVGFQGIGQRRAF